MRFIKKIKNKINKILYAKNEKEIIKEIHIFINNKDLFEMFALFSNYIIDANREYIYFNYSKMLKRDRKLFKEYIKQIKNKNKIIIEKPIIYKIKVR